MPSAFRSKVCEQCGKTWQTRKPAARTCSPLCRARLREQEQPTRGAAPREYPQEIVDLVARLYAAGQTVAEVQAAVPPGYKVQNILKRYGVPARPATPRDQRLERATTWKGDAAGYKALHLRVRVARGKPARCERCGQDDSNARYEWANLTGRYEDINDYQRMCTYCHRSYDAARRAATGRRTSPLRRGPEVMPHA